jgi:hypothetical protein
MELSEWHRWWKDRGSRGVRRLLMHEWDPIGVRNWPEAADEYDSYVGVVGRMLHDAGTAAEIERYLTNIREEHMGFGPSPEGQRRDHDVSTRLVDWYAAEMRVRPEV